MLTTSRRRVGWLGAGWSASLIAASALAMLPAALSGQQPARVQVTPAVPLDARSYDHVDALVRAGLVRSAIVGQRPYSRLEMARIAIEARARLAAAGPDGRDGARLGRTVSALEAEFARERTLLAGSAAAVRAQADGASMGAEVLDNRDRPINDVGLGAIDGRVSPLTENRGGRPAGARSTAWAEAGGFAAIGAHVAASAQTRVATQGREGRSTGPAVSIQRLSATIGSGNIVMEVGRQPVLYGQGMAGGPFSSRNSPPLDMVRVGNDLPARLPWVFGRLGPARGSLFIADLGADQFFPHEKLVGWKMSFLPSARLEMGMSLLSQQGGTGAPPASLHERVIDVLTIVDVLLLQDRDLIFSNKLAGIDVRWRAPGADLYLDVMVDDFDVRRVRGSLWEDAGFIAGVVIPGLGADGSGRMEAEYQHTGLRYYQHGQFQSGVTAGGHIIGLAVGPRADVMQARLAWDPVATSTLALQGAAERRSDDRYETAFGENDTRFRFVKIEDRPEEFRFRLVASGTREAGLGRVLLELGAERVARWNFQRESSRTNLLARIAFIAGFR